MRKIIHGALLAGMVPFGMVGEAVAGPLAPIVNKANSLRLTAWSLNQKATGVEHSIEQLKKQGVDVSRLKRQARSLRVEAKYLALESNRTAKQAFNMGYHRSAHSHPTAG